MQHQGYVRQTVTIVTVAMGFLLAFGPAFVEAGAARSAKDAAEQSKALAAAARFLQGPGFVDPMVSAENVDNLLLAVDVDHKGWSRMDRNQRLEFVEQINKGVLGANGGIAIDVHVSMNGTKVAKSNFAGGQQQIRLVE